MLQTCFIYKDFLLFSLRNSRVDSPFEFFSTRNSITKGCLHLEIKVLGAFFSPIC